MPLERARRKAGPLAPRPLGNRATLESEGDQKTLSLNLSPSVASADSRRSGHARQGRQAGASLEILRVPQWNGLDWLPHGFSTRKGGVSRIAGDSAGELNLGYGAADLPEAVSTNRELFLGSIVDRTESPQLRSGLVTLKQMHSSLTRRVDRTDVADRASLWGDGLISDDPGVLLGIQTADCLPILVADRKRRAVGAFHAGWRGTLKRIVEKGVCSMRDEFGSEPEDLTAAIGAGIGSCCFVVGDEVRQLFRGQFHYAEELFASALDLRLDLVEANRRQLLAAGLPPEAVFALKECTSCRTDRFFSYRAEKGKTGRMMAVIGIAPG